MADTKIKNPDDVEDLAQAHHSFERSEKTKPWYQCLGPGLITGAADDDPSGIGTYSANGAQYGYAYLWLVPVCIPLMIAVQEMCGRLAAITGTGFAAIVKANFKPWILYGTGSLLLIANIFNIYADLNVMASTSQMLFGIPLWLGILIFTIVLVVSQIIIPYHYYVNVLKYLCLALLGYAVVVFMPGMKNNWGAIAQGLVTLHVRFQPDIILAIVAFLGTTISPYLFFWQAGETVEEMIAEGNEDEPGERKAPVSKEEIRQLRVDTIIGMVVSQLVAFFIIIATAGTLNAHGITHIDTAQQAAQALAPLGPAAVWIFSLCMIGTGLIAIPTLAGSAAYAMAETFNWRYGLYRRFSRAKKFYLGLAAMIIIGALLNFVHAIDPIKALVYSAALNGVIAPPLIALLLIICNRKKIMGSKINGLWSNALGWLTVVLMGIAAVYLIYAMATGQS